MMEESQLFFNKVLLYFVLPTVLTAEQLLRDVLVLLKQIILKFFYNIKQVSYHILFHFQVFEEFCRFP